MMPNSDNKKIWSDQPTVAETANDVEIYYKNSADAAWGGIYKNQLLKLSQKIFWIPAVAYSGDSSKYSNNFAKTKKKRKSL